MRPVANAPVLQLGGDRVEPDDEDQERREPHRDPQNECEASERDERGRIRVTAMGAPLQLPAKYDGDHSAPPHNLRRIVG